MIVAQETTYSEIIETYNVLKQKYNLPEYDDLDKEFQLTQSLLLYLRKPYDNILLSAISRNISEKLSNIANGYSEFLYSTQPTIIVQESKITLEKYKEDINFEYFNTVVVLKKLWVSYLESDEKLAETIIESFNYYKKAKVKFIEIFNSNIEHLSNADLSKYLTKQHKTNYYG